MTKNMIVNRKKMNEFLEAANSLIESAQHPYDCWDSFGDEPDTDDLRDLHEDAGYVRTLMESLFHFDKPNWSWEEIKTREGGDPNRSYDEDYQ